VPANPEPAILDVLTSLTPTQTSQPGTDLTRAMASLLTQISRHEKAAEGEQHQDQSGSALGQERHARQEPSRQVVQALGAALPTPQGTPLLHYSPGVEVRVSTPKLVRAALGTNNAGGVRSPNGGDCPCLSLYLPATPYSQSQSWL